jgi:hypothetical protein
MTDCYICTELDETDCEICKKHICEKHMHTIICTEAYHLFLCPSCYQKFHDKLGDFIKIRQQLTELYNKADELENLSDEYLEKLNEEQKH